MPLVLLTEGDVSETGESFIQAPEGKCLVKISCIGSETIMFGAHRRVFARFFWGLTGSGLINVHELFTIEV
jgi:hypothetical protein